jgi:hypothetical protein
MEDRKMATPAELRQSLQDELDAKLAASEPYALVIMFDDDKAYVTNENKQVIAHDQDPTGSPPNPPTGGMNIVRWFTGSPLCVWFSGKRR